MSLKDKSWEEVQIKAFTHWVNMQLQSKNVKVDNLEKDLSDGVRLTYLIEALTNAKQTKKWIKEPKNRVQYIENSHLALMLLKESGRVKNMKDFGAEDFVDGNLKLILGFLWTMLRTFRTFGDGDSKDDGGRYEDALLAWLRETLSEYDLKINDFTTSFQDGRVLLALLNKMDDSYVDFGAVDASKKTENNTQAFKTAEEKVNVPQLLDADQVAAGEADERSVVLYVSLLQSAYASLMKSRDASAQKQGFASKMEDLKAQLLAEQNEKAEVIASRNALQAKVDDLQARLDAALKENAELKARVAALEAENADLKKNQDGLSKNGSYLNEKIDVMKTLLQQEQDEKAELLTLKDKLERDIKNLQREKSELESEREQLQRERDALEAEQKDMLDAMEKFKQAKKKLEDQFSERAGLNMRGLDVLRKNLLEHLTDMNTWKKYLEQDREYKSETIQSVTEKAVAGQSFEDQLSSLSTALQSENSKLQGLLKEHELEVVQKQAAKKKAAEAAAAKKK